MKFCALILVTGYILSIGSSQVQDDCWCQRPGRQGKIIHETIFLTKEDVVIVDCTQSDPGQQYDFGWEAIGESQTVVESGYVSRFRENLTIRGDSIHVHDSKFECSLQNRVNGKLLQKWSCCTVIVKIEPSENDSTQATPMQTFSATSPQKGFDTPSATAAPEINLPTPFNASNATSASFRTVAFPTSISFQTATISATVSVIAVLLLGVGAAVIIVLKRKLLSDRVISDDSSDNLAYLLDVKQQQVWNGNEIIPIDTLVIGNVLGEGKFGTVAEGKLRTACKKGTIYDRRVAIKMLKNQEGVNPEELKKEAEVIVKLGQHQNVIHVYGYCMEEKCLSKIVMEYAELGDLHCHLRKIRSVGLDDVKQFSFSQQIAEGMKFVASKGCVHRDLAARNVLVCTGQRLKISDFGLAKDLQSAAYYRKTSRGGVIPFRWCAPEVLLYATYSEYSDVWSYGIVLWEIATVGGTPYPGIPVEKLFELLTGKSGYRMSKPRNCSQKLYNIMVSCWNSVPDLRPTFLCITSEIT